MKREELIEVLKDVLLTYNLYSDMSGFVLGTRNLKERIATLESGGDDILLSPVDKGDNFICGKCRFVKESTYHDQMWCRDCQQGNHFEADKGEAEMTAEEFLKEKYHTKNISGESVFSLQRHIEDMEEYSALRKVETSILMPMSAREWFAKETNRKVEEFDDYDLHVCRVAEGYARTVKVEMPSDDDIKEQFPIKSETTALTSLFIERNMNRREGAKWAIEQIKHLNKLI